MSDNITSSMLLIASRIASKPPNETHPYGHGKVADVGALLMGLTLLGIAFYIVYETLSKYVYGYRLEYVYIPLALIVLALTSLVKEFLARYAIYLSKHSNSLLCRVDAWHHRIDALIGMATAISILIYFLTRLVLVDVIMSLIISALIIREGIKIIKESILALVDTLSPYLESIVKETAREIKEIEYVHDIRTRSYGGRYYIELKMHVRPDISVDEAHRIAHEFEEKVKKRDERIMEVITHIEPESKIKHSDNT